MTLRLGLIQEEENKRRRRITQETEMEVTLIRRERCEERKEGGGRLADEDPKQP
jgi:hypothetical protein